MEKLAEELYTALTELLNNNRTTDLMTAVGHAKMRVPFDKVGPKTRVIFLELAENLTRVQAKR